MKIEDIKALSDEELSQKVYQLKEELFHLRRRKAVGQLEHPEQIHSIRKDIARIYTVQRERQIGLK